MPTNSEFSRVDFSKPQDGNYRQHGDATSGEFGFVTQPSLDDSNGGADGEPSTYPNIFGGGYDANNRQFSQDKSNEPEQLARETDQSQSDFADLQKFLNNSSYTLGSRACHEAKERWTSPHGATNNEGKTGPA